MGQSAPRGAPPNAQELIERLPQRFDPNGMYAQGRWRLRVGDTVRDVVVDAGGCRVVASAGRTDAEISTDPQTWAAIYGGRMSGIEAFVARRLWVRGSIERALHFEPMFRRPRSGGLRYELRDVPAGGTRISTLLAGPADGEPVVLLHGLGATKASWLTVVPRLARTYRVVAVDLPGFGRSGKPWGSYDAAWFAGHVFQLLDRLGHESAHIAGNSMGGKVAMEMAMLDPERVRSVACMCPASAFSRRPLLRLVRLLRPELGCLVFGRLPRGRLRAGLRALFAEPDRIDDVWYEAAIDDFCRVWRDLRARNAFLAAARAIYLEEPEGEVGFFTRLGLMRTPALYVFGEHDALISPRFARKIREILPRAEVHVWTDCGHVPQIEHPERTAAVMADFFARSASPARAS